ncbi:MAG: hypothetical protein QNK05_04965 [Myxococcota bacterium]|nr:hypothetical protein [Myxococcota bacterium]
MTLSIRSFRAALGNLLHRLGMALMLTPILPTLLVVPAAADPADDVLPKQVVIREVYATSNTGAVPVSFPVDVILQTITVAPGSIDTDPNLHNCSATVRWPYERKSGAEAIHPGSNGHIVIDHSWGGANQISLNYSFPYELVLPKGTVLEASVGRVGTSGFCDGVIVFTGTLH